MASALCAPSNNCSGDRDDEVAIVVGVGGALGSDRDWPKRRRRIVRIGIVVTSDRRPVSICAFLGGGSGTTCRGPKLAGSVNVAPVPLRVKAEPGARM